MDQKQLDLENFKAMANNEDDGIALQYLDNNNWDLLAAVEQYQNTHQFSQAPAPHTPSPVPNPGGAGIGIQDNADQEMSAFDDVPDMQNIGAPAPGENRPSPVPGADPTSMFQNIASSMSGMAASMGGVMHNMASNFMGGGMGGGMNPPASSDDSNYTPSQQFLLGFRKKNGNGIDLPNFVNNTFSEIEQESKRLKRPVFIYMHNDKGDS